MINKFRSLLQSKYDLMILKCEIKIIRNQPQSNLMFMNALM